MSQEQHSNDNIGDKLRELSKSKGKRERWIRSRMWFSTLMSAIFPDMGHIPENIGNNIFIGNNQYLTKNSISSLILIKELSEDTPIGFVSDFLEQVKSKVDKVRVDFTFKNHKYVVDPRDKGLENREKQWMNTLSNKASLERTKSRAARLLYTSDIIKSGERMYRTHIYVTLRAQDGASMRQALNAAQNYLKEINAEYKVIKSDLKNHLEYVAAVSDKSAGRIKEIPHTIQSALTLAEMLPVVQGMNDDKGLLMGITKQNQSPYYIDYRRTSAGKNIYVVGQSGEGKTFLVVNWGLDGYAIMYRLSFMDVKGTDYDAFIKATGGVTVSMRSDSTEFINTFVMNPNKHSDNPELYFKERFKKSKRLLLNISDLKPEHVTRGSALLESFLESMYVDLGVLAKNHNSWYRTEGLHPFNVYERFKSYLSPQILSAYGDVADTMLTNMYEYLDPKGSESHMFTTEYRIEDLLDSRAIRFDFGLLTTGRHRSNVSFKIRVDFMREINDEYSTYQKEQGNWVIKVLEESQIVEDYIMDVYVEEMTLRRAQNQVTVLLGNSTSALEQNPKARPLLDNFNILVIGVVPKSSRNFLINEYSLENQEEALQSIYSDPDYKNTFLLVNRMQKDSPVALLKVHVPDAVRDGKIFKNVDTEEEA